VHTYITGYVAASSGALALDAVLELKDSKLKEVLRKIEICMFKRC
jgi:hypothetical protein